MHCKRNISDILLFRQDFSPFLVHLTRKGSDGTASETLAKILKESKLRPGTERVSDATFGGSMKGIKRDEQRDLFCATCFTETPLSEVHCLLDIDKRTIDLEPYGLVFLKRKLELRGVASVLYLNNLDGSQQAVLEALFKLRQSDPDAAKRLLPLISIFGKRVVAPGATLTTGRQDWRWEREWRRPFGSCSKSYESVDGAKVKPRGSRKAA